MYSWASILDAQTLEQALRTSRSPVLKGHVALMPDAHLGSGATVGSVMQTENAIIPAAVGVDIGCGMIAVKTDLRRERLLEPTCRRILGKIRDTVPAGVGKAHEHPIPEALVFVARHGWSPCTEGQPELQRRALQQFGTLGDGNHFAEVAEDEEGYVWVIVHSGSRGVGRMLADHHIRQAEGYCEANGLAVEDRALSFLLAGTPEFDAYVADMLWAQEYARYQREAMMTRVLEAISTEGFFFNEFSRVNCHHNYAEHDGRGTWTIRKGAIAAGIGDRGVIPGSMGDATYIVEGLGNAQSYHSSPHGAGRVLSRGGARRELDVAEFRQRMEGKTWQDLQADDLIDEAPMAYKPIETVIADSADLVTPVAVLRQFINYKGIGQRRKKGAA